ncbi:MAG: hypothetical protein GX303_04930 [Clostridiales bacterium]|nr:hypothetical protein [Clostridiales bacterium]
MVSNIKKFKDEDEKRRFVAECEARFEAQLDAATEKIAANSDVRIITLSGPTCSGKTTTANKLTRVFTEYGKIVHIISIDDFYLNRDVLNNRSMAEGGKIDYDSVHTIDLVTLEACVEDIFEGGWVKLPRYDFVSGTRSGYEEIEISDRDLFIFEGIQAVYPEITDLFNLHPFISIYISVAEDLYLDGDCFSRFDIRFFRRLVRDYNFRNARPEFTFKIWESVRSNEDVSIIPYENVSDIILNSLLPYELGVIKPYLIEILGLIDKDSEYYERAQAIVRRFDDIEEISRDYIPEYSVYREFLG